MHMNLYECVKTVFHELYYLLFHTDFKLFYQEHMKLSEIQQQRSTTEYHTAYQIYRT